MAPISLRALASTCPFSVGCRPLIPSQPITRDAFFFFLSKFLFQCQFTHITVCSVSGVEMRDPVLPNSSRSGSLLRARPVSPIPAQRFFSGVRRSLDFGHPVTLRIGVQNVKCVCARVWFFLRSHSFYFRRQAGGLLVLGIFMAGKTPTCPNHVLVLFPLSLKFLRSLCLRTVTDGRKETRAAELLGAPVPGLSSWALWGSRPTSRPPFPRGREQRPRSGAGPAAV